MDVSGVGLSGLGCRPTTALIPFSWGVLLKVIVGLVIVVLAPGVLQ